MRLWIQRLNQELRFYDRELHAKDDGDRVNVYRYRKAYDKHEIHGGAVVFVLKKQSEYVMSLTDNWALSGRPVLRGIEQVMSRIREIDSHNRSDWFEEFKREREIIDQSIERKQKSDCEAIASETRTEFKKAFNDYNVSSLAPKRKV
jgi:hypothetical protein